MKKDKVYTLMASQIAAICASMAAGNKITAIKEFREATGTDLKDAKDVIEGNFEREIPVLKVGQKIRVSPRANSWSYEGRIYETDGDNFKLIQDKVRGISYQGAGHLRSERASSIINTGWNLEILAD